MIGELGWKTTTTLEFLLQNSNKEGIRDKNETWSSKIYEISFVFLLVPWAREGERRGFALFCLAKKMCKMFMK